MAIKHTVIRNSGSANPAGGFSLVWTLLVAVFLLSPFSVSRVEARTGEALVAAKSGDAEVRTFVHSVHEGQTETRQLFDGASLGETDVIQTGSDGHLCMVMTPGAIVCVAPDTTLTLTTLRHSSDGLPKKEQDLIRTVEINLQRGRLYIHAGTPSASMEIRVTTPAGEVFSQGGSFIIAEDEGSRWVVFNEEYDGVEVRSVSGTESLKEGESASIEKEKSPEIMQEDAQDLSLREFEICQALFDYLDPFFDPVQGFDRSGFATFLGLSGSPFSLGAAVDTSDVSPSFRDTRSAGGPDAGFRQGSPDGRRWGHRKIWDWWHRVGVVRGVNYIPRTAVNSTEFWMEETFDPDTIDEELGWAQDLGYTDIRIQLQYVVWENDSEGFLDRLHQMLDIADRHGLRVVPVLFDDLNLAGKEPTVGEPPEPVPGEHNRQWTPSPGGARVTGQDAWPELKKFVQGVVQEFSADERILYWDLYNTVGNHDMGEQSLPLMDQTINWAREIDPEQPIAVPAWKDFDGAMTARKLERSDLITFHSFDAPEVVEAKLQYLKIYDRPIFCSDWLMRQKENEFETLLPLFSDYNVGWFNRGLVQGETQTYIQQPQYRTDLPEDLWQHDVLKEDGEPYREKEAEMIRAFTYSRDENP